MKPIPFKSGTALGIAAILVLLHWFGNYILLSGKNKTNKSLVLKKLLLLQVYFDNLGLVNTLYLSV